MKIVFASHNLNKVKEISKQLPDDIEILSLDDINCHEDISETGNTIESNAIIKANYVTEKYGLPCFADDTGLEIEALNGEPGVFSARYAGIEKNDDNNMNLVLEKLAGQTNRNAQFKTVIALHINNEQHLFTGIVKGRITETKIGTNGFGYDPIFMPDSNQLTFAQMDLEQKNNISHRGKAVKQLIDFLNNNVSS